MYLSTCLNRVFCSPKLVTAESLDREAARSHMLVITCYDHGMPSMTSYRSVTVNVTDVNDNQPVFTMASHTGNNFHIFAAAVNARISVSFNLHTNIALQRGSAR
jgi:hypothetical protein